MSGIAPDAWYRGRRGIYDTQGRIVPDTEVGAPQTFPGQGDGQDLSLWAVWNPYERTEVGNLYTPGSTYTQLADTSGNGRDMVVLGSAPDASAEVFPGKLGLTSVPQCTGSRRLRHLEGADVPLQSFTFATAGPYSTSVGNTESEYQFIRGSLGGGLMALRQGVSPGQRRLWASGSAGSFGPTITFPQVGAGTSSWILYVFRRQWDGVSASTANWRMTLLGDTGSGPTSYYDSVFSESATTQGTTASRMAEFRGFKNESPGDKGTAAMYLSAVDDDVYLDVALAAAAQLGSSVRSSVATLLGV